MNEAVIYHHGIKGQKWGVRRYQNKDGTLTAAGKKREQKMNDKLKSANKELKKLRAENKSLKRSTSANSRAVNEMSDDELRQKINRLNMEKQYADIYRQVHPTKPNPGKEFMNRMLKETVAPALINVGKSALEKSLKKAMGLEDKPDPNKQLELASKKLEYASKQIDYENKKLDLDAKRNPKVNRLDEELKRLKTEYEIGDYKNKISKLGKDDTSVADVIDKLASMSQKDKDKIASAAKVQENLNKLAKGK